MKKKLKFLEKQLSSCQRYVTSGTIEADFPLYARIEFLINFFRSNSDLIDIIHWEDLDFLVDSEISSRSQVKKVIYSSKMKKIIKIIKKSKKAKMMTENIAIKPIQPPNFAKNEGSLSILFVKFAVNLAKKISWLWLK
jgi:hypothetical protein